MSANGRGAGRGAGAAGVEESPAGRSLTADGATPRLATLQALLVATLLLVAVLRADEDQEDDEPGMPEGFRQSVALYGRATRTTSVLERWRLRIAARTRLWW